MLAVWPESVTLAREDIRKVFDSLTVARRLTDAGMNRELADATAAAIREAAEHGDHVTLELLRAELSALETRLIKWMVGTVIAAVGATVAALRLMG